MIGKKLKEYRLSLKLTGETLAGLAGIKRSWLSQIENEKKVPPFDTFMDLVNAIAKVSPLNYKNAGDILNENNYQRFIGLIEFIPLNGGKGNAEMGINNLEEGVEDDYVTSFSTDSNYDVINGMYYTLDESTFNEVMAEKFDSELRYIFFDEYSSDYDKYEFGNFLEDALYPSICGFDFIRQALHEWWYNHILQDFYNREKEVDKSLPNFDSEVDILINIGALANENDEFLLNDDSSTNLTKELLDGKTVTFDLGTITDKNMRLFLDGKLLSSNEIAMLSFALGGIRHNRQKSDNK